VLLLVCHIVWCYFWRITLLLILSVHHIVTFTLVCFVVSVITNVLHCCTPFGTKYTPSPFPLLLLVFFLICQVVSATIGPLCYASGGTPL